MWVSINISCSNARFDPLASVDLHGLHVAEALQVLSQLLEIHIQMGENNRSILIIIILLIIDSCKIYYPITNIAPEPKNLRVITGVGKHSLHGIAKIKPAVKNFLRSKG